MKNSLSIINSILSPLCWFLNKKNIITKTIYHSHAQFVFQQKALQILSAEESKRHFKDSNKINSPQVSWIFFNKKQGWKKLKIQERKILKIELQITSKPSGVTQEAQEFMTQGFFWCF